LAKLVVFDKDRQRAVQRAKRAFNEFIIEGVPTLIPLYKILLENQNFKDGKFSTDFIEKEKILENLPPQPLLKKEIVFEPGKTLDYCPPTTRQGKNHEFEKEIAFLIAKIYQEMKKKESEAPAINKWRLFKRMSIYED